MAEDWCVLSDTDVEQVRQYVKESGVSGIVNYLTYKTNEWKHVTINIGVVGESAVGKSSFINCMRDLTADDTGGAPVGTGDTTCEPTKYCHPYNEELAFWDLPGIGTPNYPRSEKYLEHINIELYDFFLILSDSRFSENDVWLAKAVDKRGKRFFFVRTKIDETMENEKIKHGNDFSEYAVLERIIQDCQKNFMVAQLPNALVFCISNYHREMWLFEDLMHQIIVTLPDMKRNSLVLSIGPVSKQVIREKTKLLTSKIWMKASISAVGGAGSSLVPIPLVGGAACIAVDVAILVTEINFYLKQYGLDDESLQQLSQRTNTTVDYYVKSLKFASSIVTKRQSIKMFVLDMMKKEGTKVFEKRAAYECIKLIPIVGMAVAGTVSFGTCYYFLFKTIRKFETDALSIVEAAIRQTSTNI